MTTLSDLILHNARRRPDHPALEQDGTVLTYGELAATVEDRARRLRGAGIGPEMIVGVGMADTIEHVATMIAVLRTGATLLPIDIRWTPAEKSSVLAAFGAAQFLVDAVEPDVGVEQIVAGSLALGPAVAWPSDGDAPAVLSLSSGTTGLPKGACVTHRQMMMRFAADWIGLGFLNSDRFLCATPLYFGGGRGFTLNHLIGGATVILHPPPHDATALPAVLRHTRATSTFLVPTVLRRILSTFRPEETGRIETLRLLISSGSALQPDERTAVMRLLTDNFYNLYGTTECGVISLLTPDAGDDAADSVGPPAVMSQFEVVDDQDRLVPAGTVGHIRHRAPWLPEGFWRNPTESKKCFRHGCFYPGDLGRIDEAGFLRIAGRSKDMIIRGGVNIYPDEIESVLLTHPAVQEAAVVAWRSRDRGEEVAAFVTLRNVTDPVELRLHCRGSLAAYKVPLEIFVLDDLPRNTSGKIMKGKLSERLDLI